MARFALAAVLVALVAAPTALAQEPSPVVGSGERIGGRDLAAWETSWHRWVFSIPRSAFDGANTCLPQPAPGPVWFLLAPGGPDDHVVSVDCSIPAGTYLYLGTPSVMCTDQVLPPEYPLTKKGLRRCARDAWHVLADPHPRLVLDGRPLEHGPVVRTDVFRFRSGGRGGRAAAVARATMLRPLAPGVHTLIQGIRYRGVHNIVAVYNLTVA